MRKQGRPGRFCPGADHGRLYYREGGREYAQVLKDRRAASLPRKRPKSSEEERVRKAKDRAADALAAYNEQRRKKLATVRPRYGFKGIAREQEREASRL
ncbi:MAG: hypothetical protein ACREP8_05165, partial [Candidatus Binatia bacterium]